MLEVKVTVDLGEKTVALLSGSIAMAGDHKVKEPIAVEAAKPEPVETAKPETKKATRVRRTVEPAAAEEPEKANGWDEMDDDAKLEAIKTEITKHTKKGKSADIRFLLSNFDAGRASELNPEDYNAFFDAITRYGNGESIEKIFPGEEDLN